MATIASMKNSSKLSVESELAQLLGQHERTFHSEAEATLFKQNQPSVWQFLFSKLKTAGNGCINVRNRITSFLPNYRCDHEETDDGYLVRGRLPILDNEIVAQLDRIAENNALLVWGALFIECPPAFQGGQLTLIDVDVLLAALSYLMGGVPPKDVSGVLSNAKQISIALASELTKQREIVTNFISERTIELEAFKASLAESFKLRASSSLWSSRAKWHRIGLMIWFSIFAGITIGLLVYLIPRIPEIAGYLPKEANGAFPYVSVLFVLIPAVGIGWVLRIISRFINNNQVLADDARHREVMTQTYLNLVADKSSGVTEQDRLIMLSAIFRPLPGAQTDEVAPPTILDLLKKEN